MNPPSFFWGKIPDTFLKLSKFLMKFVLLTNELGEYY